MLIENEALSRARQFVETLRNSGQSAMDEEDILERAFNLRRDGGLVDSGQESADSLNRAAQVLLWRNWVTASLESGVRENLRFLLDSERLWQPAERSGGPASGLPDFSSGDWQEKIHTLQAYASAVPPSLFIVLIGNMVTEEALPNYKTVLDKIEATANLSGADSSPWARWSCGWTAEEDRHGSVLRDYISYSGMADMRAVDRSIFSLLANGFDPRIGYDPYKLFIYTSFQERATRISHRNTGRRAAEAGDPVLESICTAIAGDESRHEAFYKNMMALVFDSDPHGALLAFERLMRSQIVMPAELMQDGEPDLYAHFSLVAQQEKVYTTEDYVSIIEHLNGFWRVGERSATGAAARAQEYVCALPERYRRSLVPRTQRVLDRLERRPYAWLRGRLV